MEGLLEKEHQHTCSGGDLELRSVDAVIQELDQETLREGCLVVVYGTPLATDKGTDVAPL